MQDITLVENGNVNIPPQLLKSTISVECPRMNESTFRGTINYTEAKEIFFVTGLGLSANLLSSVRMTFKNYPTVHFKLTKEIDLFLPS